jgi:hypothetical protein
MGTESDIRSWKKDDIVGTPISYVIYFINYKVTLRIIFYVLFGFSISEKTKVAFFWYEYLRIYMYVRYYEILGTNSLSHKV